MASTGFIISRDEMVEVRDAIIFSEGQDLVLWLMFEVKEVKFW
jgi:hypothetical protein